MKNLLLFLNKYAYWLLFLVLETVAAMFYISSGKYQRSAALSSCNVIVGKIYSVSGFLSSFFFLHEENAKLLEQNGILEDEIRQLRWQLHNSTYDTAFVAIPLVTPDSQIIGISHSSVVADVINNSVAKPYNYITLNKGLLDGIRSDMGVVSSEGVVGVVSAVSDHYSVVISVLNAKMKVSSKLKNGKFFGSLAWDAIDPRFAQMADLPRHATFIRGDTIVTSGFSTIFPEGIIIGTIEDYAKQKDDNFYTLKIKLSTDFYSLHQVRVLMPEKVEERVKLEQKVTANDN
ncbi:MAG: rod shape-determining protein MreC [Bacteroidales bacterium]|nr:rod shape-determining protein MreC [Bacteroidales bacterium]